MQISFGNPFNLLKKVASTVTEVDNTTEQATTSTTTGEAKMFGLGWKTITGTLIIAAGILCEHLGVDATVCGALEAAGTTLGGIGIRAAIAKIAS